MDIDTQVNGIVQNIISEITTKVQAQVADIITEKIDEVIGAIDYHSLLATKLNQQLDNKISNLKIDSGSIETVLATRVEQLASTLAVTVQQQALERVNELVTVQLNNQDFNKLFHEGLASAVTNNLIRFPAGSIPASSLDLNSLVLSGDHIQGGIIKGFGSTGIDDKAENCQLTIMDDVTVVENNLLTQDLTVKGTVTIEGDLNITGTVPEDSAFFNRVVYSSSVAVGNNHEVFQKYARMFSDQLRTDGIDLNRIKINGQDVVVNNSLGSGILNSNLQKVGELKELQVAGESLLSQTLYTTNKRVGINTIEPVAALDVWDQEVEVSISKQTTNTAIIQTPRNQALVLGSNNKQNLKLETDGTVSVAKLNFDNASISFAHTPPTDNQARGAIVFNANPTLGGPIGWVSLGEGRWANFGVID
jgi:hypothetical protein